MGRLVYSMSVSLNGFVETPSRSLDWVLVDDELHSFFNDEARSMVWRRLPPLRRGRPGDPHLTRAPMIIRGGRRCTS